MKKIDRCHVVNEKGEIIILFGHFNGFLSKEPNGKHTHALVSYYKTFDDSISKEGLTRSIFPLYQVYFVDELIDDRE